MYTCISGWYNCTFSYYIKNSFLLVLPKHTLHVMSRLNLAIACFNFRDLVVKWAQIRHDLQKKTRQTTSKIAAKTTADIPSCYGSNGVGDTFSWQKTNLRLLLFVLNKYVMIYYRLQRLLSNFLQSKQWMSSVCASWRQNATRKSKHRAGETFYSNTCMVWGAVGTGNLNAGVEYKLKSFQEVSGQVLSITWL